MKLPGTRKTADGAALPEQDQSGSRGDFREIDSEADDEERADASGLMDVYICAPISFES